MTMNFEIIDNETGYSISVKWYGQGMDYGDKAIYKSYTGALKYFLLDTFMISTGDDPENDNPEGHRQPVQQAKPVYTPQPMQPNQTAKIQELLASKGKTIQDLNNYTTAAFKVTNWETMNTAQANMTIKKLESMPAKEEELNVDEIDKGIEAQRAEKESENK